MIQILIVDDEKPICDPDPDEPDPRGLSLHVRI